jgi:hypothetical protein
MPRPRLTPEDLQARIAEYCARYEVEPNAEGLPPFPAGQRETQQHRDWIGVYKAHHRLARRQLGQCERCEAPVTDGTVFCAVHRGGAETNPASVPERKAVLADQASRCPICAQKVGLGDVLAPKRPGGQRAFLHARCSRFVGLAEALGPESVDRLQAYLGPRSSGKPRR